MTSSEVLDFASPTGDAPTIAVTNERVDISPRRMDQRGATLAFGVDPKEVAHDGSAIDIDDHLFVRRDVFVPRRWRMGVRVEVVPKFRSTSKVEDGVMQGPKLHHVGRVCGKAPEELFAIAVVEREAVLNQRGSNGSV